jgi:hypothetical protein
MSMEGRRFGVGLVAGLLIGLAIVAASTSLVSGQAVLFSTPGANSATGSVTTTTLSATTTTRTQVPQQSGSVPPTTGGNSSYVSGVTSTTSTTSGLAKSLGLVPAFSTDLQSIARQSPAANAFLFIPVLVALFLGALAYMVSRQGKKELSEE